MKNIEIPDQSLFEPDPNEELESKKFTKGKIIWRYVRVVVALIVLAGMLYISGVYQIFLYRRTPANITQQKMESMLDAEIITLPLQAYVFINNKSGSERSEEDVDRLVENASEIWKQAQIKLNIEKIIFLETSDEEIDIFLQNPSTFIVNLQGYNDELINIFLKESLMGLNGIAFTRLGVITIADFTTSYDFRVLAHEIGHILGLDHVIGNRGRLMYQGASGFNLTLEEIMQARQISSDYF